MKKKIIILFTTIVLAIAAIGITLIVLKKANEKTTEKKADNANEQIIEHQENFEEKVVDIVETEEQKETIEIKETDNTIPTVEPTNVTENKTEQTSQVVVTPSAKSKSTEVKQESTPQVINTQSPIVNTPIVTSSEPAVIPTPTQEIKHETKYVVNQQMIETLRQTIINNESENMKQYGYTIEVDSSIKSLTNPFTFTEIRVKNLIKHNFGTIKIYAEDYYVDGELIMTNSYII